MLSSSPPQHVVELFHNRWAVPVLAELHRGQGAKFVTLVNKLGVGRDTLSRTLRALDERGWATRNPGHGHPMRPEYILTEAGRALGPGCLALHDHLHATAYADLALKKWSVPVLLAIGDGPSRFQDVANTLADISPRALTQALKGLVKAELITRRLVDEYPPRPEYAPTKEGHAVLKRGRALSRSFSG